MIETRGHHSNDRHALPIEPHVASDDVGVAAKTTYPETIAKDDDGTRARLNFLGSKNTAQSRLHSERGKEILRDTHSIEPLRGLISVGKVVARPPVDSEMLEHLVLLAIIRKVP